MDTDFIHRPVSLGEALTCIKDQLKEENRFHILSGIDSLDAFIEGWIPGELCFVGGRPSMGKTAFVLSCISNMVFDGIPVALFSATDAMNHHFLSRVVTALKEENSAYSDELKRKAIREADMEDVPLYLCLNPDLTLSSIRKNVSSLIEEHGVRCVFIETVQSLFVSEDNGNTKEGMERICHQLKIMSREFNIPFIITSDLGRAVDYRKGIEGKMPQLSDLKSTPAIEREADTVLLLYRPEYYRITTDKFGNDMREVIEIHVAKKYSGRQGVVRARFDNSKGMVEDIGGSKRRRMMERKRQDEFIDQIANNKSLQKLIKNFDLEDNQLKPTSAFEQAPF